MNFNSLDSSAWIEIFHNGANAENFLPAISNLPQIVVSVIALYEVWRYTIQHADRARALAITELDAAGRRRVDRSRDRHRSRRSERPTEDPNGRLLDLHHCPTEFRHPLDSRRGFRGPSERPLLSENQSLIPEASYSPGNSVARSGKVILKRYADDRTIDLSRRLIEPIANSRDFTEDREGNKGENSHLHRFENPTVGRDALRRVRRFPGPRWDTLRGSQFFA